MSEDPKGSEGSSLRGVGIAAALSFQLIVATLLGFFLGHWLDGVFHSGPWLTVSGVILGIGAGFWGIYHLSRILLR
jgi:ATP synthase protein I